MTKQNRLIFATVIVLGIAIIFISYIIHIKTLQTPEIIQVPQWKYSYGSRAKEITNEKFIVSGFFERGKPNITYNVEILPYTKFYKITESIVENELSLEENLEIFDEPIQRQTLRKQIKLTDLQLGSKIYIFTPDEASEGATIRAVKIETR